MSILISTDVPFWKEEQGSQIRIASLINYLTKSNQEVIVHYIGYLKADKSQISNRYRIKLENKFNPILMLNKIMKKLKGKEPTIQYFYNKYEVEYFNELIKHYKPSNIIIEYIRLAYLVNSNNNITGSKLFIDTHDIISDRYLLHKEKGLKHWVKIEFLEEINILKGFDVIIAIQDKDKMKFKNNLPSKEVITVKHHHPVKRLESENDDENTINIAYVAGDAPTNVFSITEFVNNIWDKGLLKTEKNIVLNIYGNICSKLAQIDSKNIIKHGFADNLESVYGYNDIVINPVQAGGGLKIKNVEALCYSRPLLTTTIGAEGLETGINSAFLIADEWDKFGSMLKSLIESEKLRRELSVKSYEFAKNNFSVQAVFEELNKSLL